MLRRVALVLFTILQTSCAEPLEPEIVNTGVRGDSGRPSGNGGRDTGTPEEVGDTGTPGIDSSTPPPEDTGSAPIDTGYGGTPDTGMEPVDTGTAVTDTGTPPTSGGATVTFPAISDSFVIFDDPWMWMKGDYIQGSRKTTVSSITSISGAVGMDNSLSSCGTLDVAVKINGTSVGTMKITSSTGTSYPLSLTFSAITGPNYTLRYEALNTVASGCGSIWFDEDTTSLSLK